MLDVNRIKELIPHRYPFLLVDRIVEIVEGKKAVGIKNITANDCFCNQEYFGEGTVFPGSLQVEAMAQVSAFVVMGLVKDPSKLALLANIEQARFRKIIRPGDQLRIEVFLKRFKINTGKFNAFTYINDELASEVVFTCIITE
jgi:3-hydroxyacyl-[acyl-carrier-protein] dehydratase